MSELAARLVAYTYEGEYVGSVPAPTQVEAATPKHDLSTCKVTYSASAPRSELIDREGKVFAVQVAQVDGDQRGEWVEPPGARYAVMERGWNRTSLGRLWQIDAVGIGHLLDGAIVGRAVGVADKDGNRSLGTVNAGGLLRQLILNAKARQSDNGKRWFAPLVINFDASRDSAGQPWQMSIPVTADPQRSIAGVLDSLVKYGMCEYEWRGLELYVTNVGGLARDRTAGPNPVLLRDAQVTDAPEKSSLLDVCTDVDMVGDDGKTWSFAGKDPYSPLGRIERTISQGAVSQDSTARLHADRLLVAGARPRTQYTRASSNAAGGRLPVLDVRVGDKVLIQTDTGREPVDVIGVSVQVGPSETTWHYTLGDRIDGTLAKLARRADLALAGAGVAGGDGTPPRPPGLDMAVPAKVGSVVLSTGTYLDRSGRDRGYVLLAWPPVLQDVQGGVLDTLSGYEVWGRTSGEPSQRLVAQVSADDETVRVEDLEPGAVWEYQVRAVTRTGMVGALSDVRTVTVESDVDAPYVPTAPVLSSSAGTIMVRWDGKGVGPNTGAPVDMPPDLRAIIVRDYGTNPDSTPTRLGAIAGVTDGDFVLALQRTSGQRYYFDLIAVDHTGNESAPSAKASIIARSVADDPEIVNALGASLVADSAWIGSLTSVVVTADSLRGKVIEGATIRTGPVSTDRMEMNTGGYYQMSSANGTWGKWTVNDGLCIYSDGGQLLTQLQGRSGGTGLSIRNPNNGQMTPLAPFAFGLPSAKAGAASSEYINYNLSPGADRPGPWFESPFAADRVYFDHTGTNVQLLWSSLWVSNTDGSTDIGPNLVEQIVFIRRADTGALVLRTDLGNASGIANGVPAQEYTSSYRLNRYSAVTFDAQPLAPGSYYATSVFRAWFAFFGGSLPGWCQVRQRQILVISR